MPTCSICKRAKLHQRHGIYVCEVCDTGHCLHCGRRVELSDGAVCPHCGEDIGDGNP